MSKPLVLVVLFLIALSGIFLLVNSGKIQVADFATFQKPDEGSSNSLGWQLYTNEEAGFSIKYPPNWVIANDFILGGASVTTFANMRKGSPERVEVGVFVGKPDEGQGKQGQELFYKLVSAGVNSSVNVESENRSFTKLESLNIDGKSAIRYKSQQGESTEDSVTGVLISRPDALINIFIGNDSGQFKDEDLELFEKMLTSFKIL